MSDLALARVLFIDAADGDAERLSNQLRDAAIPVRLTLTSDRTAFESALREPNFDIAILRLTSSIAAGLEELTNYAQELAKRRVRLLACADEIGGGEHSRALLAGAADVVPAHDRDRFIAVVKREIEHARTSALVKELERRTYEAESRYRLLLESAPVAIAYVHDGMHLEANQRYLDLFGITDREELSVMPLLDVAAPSAQEAFRATLRAIQGGAHGPFEIRGRRGDVTFDATMTVADSMFEGESCWQVTITPTLELPPSAVAAVAPAAAAEAGEASPEVVELKPVEPVAAALLDDDLVHVSAADIDLVSGLLNRERLLSEWDTRIREGKGTGVVLITVDGFAPLRARIGLDESDLMIADAAGLLNETMARATTSAYQLARFADDTFVVLTEGTDFNSLQKLVQRIRNAVDRHEFEHRAAMTDVAFSIVAGNIEASDGNSRHGMTVAMRAYQQQRNEKPAGFTLVMPSLSPTQRALPKGESETLDRVERALRDESFVLLFQPIISLRGESDEHYEVFVRMPGVNNDGQLTAAEDFIDLAAHANMAGRVDRWVILQAIKLLSTHRSKGHDTRLTINVSADSITDGSFLSWLAVAIRAARLPTDALVFQIREQHVVEHPMEARALTRGLADLNCRTSISRFGASPHSLNALRGLNVDFVKLDPTLIDAVIATPTKRDELARLISALQTQGKLTIVPMVESANLLAALWQAGANFIQGHYLQEPSVDMDYDFTANEAF